jgi:3-deoxy-D-manno-octulosonate 8-phosphate phosphatase (KDO 8-P phosphatase)
MTLPRDDLLPRLAAVRLLAMDVDGVLTDGRIYWGAGPATGELVELKSFDVKDGLGLALGRAAGLNIAWITGRISEIAARRAAELGVSLLRQRVRDKGAEIRALCRELGLMPAQVAYVGDDLNDLLAFEVAGVRIAVADAAREIRDRADWVTAAGGGQGAAREVVEGILRARGEWEEAQARFLAALVEPQSGYDPLPGSGGTDQ